LDLRGAQKASPKTRAAHELVRSRVPFLDGDRRMDTDIKEIVDLIRSGELSKRTLPT
jgi:histidine ammonia-lyase/phenylalanine ammonia-lyase